PPSRDFVILRSAAAIAKTHAAPAPLLSPDPPTMAVWPSAEIETETPWKALPTAPNPRNLDPNCDQSPPLLVQVQTAPTLRLSRYPPTTAVLPPAERDTERPCLLRNTLPEPSSWGPCW